MISEDTLPIKYGSILTSYSLISLKCKKCIDFINNSLFITSYDFNILNKPPLPTSFFNIYTLFYNNILPSLVVMYGKSYYYTTNIGW